MRDESPMALASSLTARTQQLCLGLEHGAADLRGKSHQDRAKLLIGIADPAHRDTLERAWAEMAATI